MTHTYQVQNNYMVTIHVDTIVSYADPNVRNTFVSDNAYVRLGLGTRKSVPDYMCDRMSGHG